MSNAKKTAKPNQTPEEIQAAVAAAVQKLVAQGKKEGMIRAADLNAQLEKLQLTPEKIEEIYDQFDAMNIPIITAELDLGDDLDMDDRSISSLSPMSRSSILTCPAWMKRIWWTLWTWLPSTAWMTLSVCT